MAYIIKKIWTPELTEVTDRLKRLNTSALVQSDGVVFKLDKSMLERLDGSARTLAEIRERSYGRPVYSIWYERERGYQVGNIGGGVVSEIRDVELVRSIRESDLREIIARSGNGCVLSAPHGTHFITPSGKHTTTFLRLADALYSYDSLDRVSFWLQEHFECIGGVILDVWPLASIVLKTQQLLDKFVPFECFREHIANNATMAEKVLKKLARRMSSKPTILYLVGISSTGTFLRLAKNLHNELGIIHSCRFLSVFGFNNTPPEVPCLVRLESDLEWYDANEGCKWCKDPSLRSTYRIDPKYYYPRKYQEQSLSVSKKLLCQENDIPTKSYEFLLKYGETPGVLKFHKDDPNDDVANLLGHPRFVKELSAACDNIEKPRGPPGIIICPPHPAGDAIVEELSRRWPNAKKPVRKHSLFDVTERELGDIRNSAHVLVVDDVAITGTRLTQYLRAFREQIITSEDTKQITFFPLLLRMDSEAAKRRLMDGFSNHVGMNIAFTCLYELVIPNWSIRPECPWCDEQRILDLRAPVEFDDPPWASARRAALANHGVGISEEPLMFEPFAKPPTVGQGSPLAPEGTTAKAMLFIVSHVLQLMRSNQKEPLGSDDFLHRFVLFWSGSGKDKHDLVNRFQEPMIQSAFLRATKPGEWSRTTDEIGMANAATKLEQGQSDALIGELILFLLRRNSSVPVPNKVVQRALRAHKDQTVKALLRVRNQ
jgi:hypothetical protein